MNVTKHAQKIHPQQPAGSRPPLTGKLSYQPGLQRKADKIAKCRLEYISRTTALRKDRHPDKAQQRVAAYRGSPQAAAQQQSGQQREEKLQREDIRSHWNLDKGAHCHQGDKKCAEHQFP